MLKNKLLPCIALSLISTASQAVTVSFSGVMDGFNAGPFSGGTAFTGSFILDESVAATGGVSTFSGAVDNFMLEIDGNVFTGNNGTARQFSSASGATDFFTVDIGGANGSVSGIAGLDVFTGFSVDWRGPNLFSDTTVLAHDLTVADFGYTRVVFGFNNLTSESVIDNASVINFGSVSAVPVPAAVWLFGSGLLGLVGVARRKRA